MIYSIAIIDKRRPAANVAAVHHIIGEVEDKDCIIVDDMVDTAGTLTKAAEALMEHGARSVSAVCTHAVLSGPAVERIEASVLGQVLVTDTIAQSDSARKCSKIKYHSVSGLLGEAIRRISDEESVSSLFV